MIAEAEDEKSSAFAVSQEDIDAVLVKGSSYADGKYRIYHQFQKREDKKSNIEFLKKEYGVSGGTAEQDTMLGRYAKNKLKDVIAWK